jgi:hypothetical protein
MGFEQDENSKARQNGIRFIFVPDLARNESLFGF